MCTFDVVTAALYYLRCFQFFGTLAIIVIQMLAKDIIRIIIIYVCCLVGAALHCSSPTQTALAATATGLSDWTGGGGGVIQ